MKKFFCKKRKKGCCKLRKYEVIISQQKGKFNAEEFAALLAQAIQTRGLIDENEVKQAG